MKVQIRANRKHKQLWLSSKRYIIEMGGRGAGRSYETSQKVGGKLVQSKPFRASIMRAIHSDIRHSNWQELVDRVTGWDIDGKVSIGESTMQMKYGKNAVHAHGFKKSSEARTAKLKSLAGYTEAYIEEAEEITEADFQQLDDSLRAAGSQIHMSLNTPAKNHWIVKRWFNVKPALDEHGVPIAGFYTLELKPEFADQVEFIFSTHQDNPYLDQTVHDRYEAYRYTKPEYYWHAIRGLCPEVLQGKIYSGWREIPEVPHEARLIGRGLDFGFDPDPAAVVDVYYHNSGYILDEQVYATRLTNDLLATRIKLLPNPNAPIIGDSAEPKSIAELALLGVIVTPCEKGKDSVNFGIKHVQALRVSYTARSINLKAEYENYAWKRNKGAVGEENHLGIEDPGCANHLMSAARYFLTEMVKADTDPEADERRRKSAEQTTEQNRQARLAQNRSDTGA